MPTYSMLAVYEWSNQGEILPKFERRVTLCRAENVEDAEVSLLKEAREYCDDIISFNEEYVIQELLDDDFTEPCEVSSDLMLAVDIHGKPISYDDFMTANWDHDRLDNCEKIGLKHVWLKLSEGKSGCYNCRVTGEGQLWL